MPTTIYPHTPLHASRGMLEDTPHIVEIISEATGPVIEVGGPTSQGYNLLGKTAVLPETPFVSNLNPNTGLVDLIFDAKEMPFPDKSVGIFLARCMSYADFFEHPQIEQEALGELATNEYDLLLQDNKYNPKYNLRLAILKEMARTTKSGGIVIFERIKSKDISCAEATGLRVVHSPRVGNDLFDVIFQAESN